MVQRSFSTEHISEPRVATPGFAAQKEGCAERIAPIGTLSQNGYGEGLGTHNRTVCKPDGTEQAPLSSS